jgi:hypothetical protein
VGPLGPDETITVQATGDNGECTGIPADAESLDIQLTAVGATETSFLTLYNADLAQRPLISHLNPSASVPRTSNTTIVSLSASGQFKIYNFAGNVEVVIDVLGVFAPGQGGTPGPQGPAGPAGPAGAAGPAGPAGTSAHFLQFGDTYCYTLAGTSSLGCYDYVSPSSNANNEANGRPYYSLDTVGTDTTVTYHARTTGAGVLCFETRVDGELNTVAGPNPLQPPIDDGRWVQNCVNSTDATRVVSDASLIEIRAVYGAESDERFNWEPNIIN